MDERDLRNTAAVRRMYSGDDTEFATIADDIVWHVPGHNRVSGEYRGREAYTRDMSAGMAPLDRWEFEVLDVMPNGDLVMATVRMRGERKGVALDVLGGHVMRLDDDGRVVEGWGFASDQDALDRFFSA